MGRKSTQVYGSWLDPRPDLANDAGLWAAVLAEAMRSDPHPNESKSLFGLLHGLRCGGAHLVITEKGTLRLDYSPLVTIGLWSNKELRGMWLLPAADMIKVVFQKIEKRIQGGGDQEALLQAAVGM